MPHSAITNRLSDGLRRLFRAGLFDIFGADALNKVLTFVSGMIVVRLIPQEVYGVYSYAYNILNIILLFNGLGASSAILQLTSERTFADRKRDIEIAGMRMGFAFDLLLLLAMLLCPLFIDLPLEGSGAMLRFWCIYPCLQLAYDIQLVSLRSSLRNREYALSTNVNTVLVLLGSAIGAAAAGPYGLIAGRSLAMVLSVVMIARLFRVPDSLYSLSFFFGGEGEAEGDSRQGRRKLNKHEMRSFAGVAVTTAVNSGINQLVYYLGTAAIGALTSNAIDIALFQTTLAIPTALNFIPSTLALFIYPYFARHKDEPQWVLRRYGQVMLATVLLAAVTSVGIASLAPWILNTLYGESYVQGSNILRILMLGWFFSATLRTIASNLLITQRRLVYGIIVAAGSAILIIALNWLLVPHFGIVGAAWAQVLVYIISGLAYSSYFIISVMRRRC